MSEILKIEPRPIIFFDMLLNLKALEIQLFNTIVIDCSIYSRPARLLNQVQQIKFREVLNNLHRFYFSSQLSNASFEKM